MASRMLALILLSLSSRATAQVRVWQGSFTLPTYQEGAPDPNPAFDQYAKGRFNYPYTLRTNLTDRRTEHAWRAVFLENKYLKCWVLPDLGGHLYTCTDKVSGQPMFYANPSIKKAAISYRGAWAAFGIEFNFPISHNWVSLSPVDFSFRTNHDGSASVIVGNVDRVYGMQWTVELVLRPDSTVLEQKVTLSNRSDVRHRFYWWNNAGVEVWDDSRIEYPMRFTASHGFRDVTPWPVEADGTDLSIVRNQVHGPVSLFAHGSREPFMGVWHPHTNTGTVHFADYAQLPAKKIWSWGTDADGLDWRKTLSDNHSAYVEVQAGLFRNQETYAFLQPREAIKFSEFWMPVRDIGGISRANLNGVVHLSRKDNALLIGLNVNDIIAKARLRVSVEGQTVLQEEADLAPERTWKKEIAGVKPDQKYTFELLNAKGAVLIRHTEGQYDWTPAEEIQVGPQSVYRTPDPERRSEDDWLQFGTQQELDGDLLAAWQAYQEALAKFSESLELRKAAGRLSVALLRFEEAKQFLEPVHARNTSDPEVSYYLAIAYDAIGRKREARECYEAASRLPALKSAAALRLGELLAREGDLSGAESFLQLASELAPNDLRSAEELSAILRARGQKDKSQKLTQEWLIRFPQSYFLLEVAGRPDLSHLANDSDRVLNVASEYMRLGMYSEALQVLSRTYPGAVADESEPAEIAPQSHPLVAYYRGYCREKIGQSGAVDFGIAAKLSPHYVFPSRAEDIEVLLAALKANPRDANAHYLMGTFYFSKGATDQALPEWNQARELNSQIPVLHASLGRALLHVKKDPEGALQVFQEGLRTDSQNVALYTGIDQALSILRHPPHERVLALEQYPDQDNMPTSLVYELILNLTESGEFDKAAGFFHNRFFQREEGGTNVRQVWLEVRIQQALSRAESGQCSEAIKLVDQMAEAVPDLPFTHDGLQPFLRSARSHYLVGSVYQTCNLPDRARDHFTRAAEKSNLEDAVWAWKASQQLPSFDPGSAKTRLQSILEKVRYTGESSSPSGWWLYNVALLDRAAGNDQEAEPKFREALLSADTLMTYHLTRLAMRDSGR